MGLAVLMALACTGEPRTPTSVGNDSGPEGNGGGTSTGGGSASALVGSWRNQLILQSPTDLVTVTTVWTFDAAGGCQKNVVSFSVVEGFPRTTMRDCTYQIAGTSLMVSYADGGADTFSFGFPDLLPDRLMLGEFIFDRVS